MARESQKQPVLSKERRRSCALSSHWSLSSHSAGTGDRQETWIYVMGTQGLSTGYFQQLPWAHGAVAVQSYNQQLSWCFIWGSWAAALKAGVHAQDRAWSTCVWGINKHWSILRFSQLQLPEQCWAPSSAQWASLFPAPAAGHCDERCSKQRFARDACVGTDSKRTVLQLAPGVQSNFCQNESKSWLLQHFIFKKQANMPSLSAGTGAAVGKQWIVHTGTYWVILKGTT